LFLKVIVWIVIVLVIVSGVAVIFLTKGMGAVKKVELKELNLSGIPDGTYKGHFDGARWTNTLEVTVTDEDITEIKIISPPSYVEDDFSNKLINTVRAKQSLDIDVVSGATVTTKAMLKAIENALSGK
jgi:uncharacterized protein with FMN-binding domain